jgi:hypothetical protein
VYCDGYYLVEDDIPFGICAFLGYYAVSCGNCLPTFRDNVSVPSTKVKTLDSGRWDRYVVPKRR